MNKSQKRTTQKQQVQDEEPKNIFINRLQYPVPRGPFEERPRGNLYNVIKNLKETSVTTTPLKDLDRL